MVSSEYLHQRMEYSDGCRTSVFKGIKAKVEQFPEWEKEINLYFEGSKKMIGGLIPGTSEYAIELYKRGYKLFALSNWSYETFYNVTGFEFFKYLSGMVVSGYEKIVKPSPEIYKLLMSRYQIIASECIFIDDIQHNVDGARAVGMQALQFSLNYSQIQHVAQRVVNQLFAGHLR